MTMPTLTADAALRRASGSYRARTALGVRARGAVRAAAAIYSGGRFVCYGEVTPEGFIDCYPLGGVGEPRCRPQCQPCRYIPSLGGRFRVCVTRDCDVDFRRC
jgi:hypothetical protein